MNEICYKKQSFVLLDFHYKQLQFLYNKIITIIQLDIVN